MKRSIVNTNKLCIVNNNSSVIAGNVDSSIAAELTAVNCNVATTGRVSYIYSILEVFCNYVINSKCCRLLNNVDSTLSIRAANNCEILNANCAVYVNVDCASCSGCDCVTLTVKSDCLIKNNRTVKSKTCKESYCVACLSYLNSLFKSVVTYTVNRSNCSLNYVVVAFLNKSKSFSKKITLKISVELATGDEGYLATCTAVNRFNCGSVRCVSNKCTAGNRNRSNCLIAAITNILNGNCRHCHTNKLTACDRKISGKESDCISSVTAVTVTNKLTACNCKITVLRMINSAEFALNFTAVNLEVCVITRAISCNSVPSTEKLTAVNYKLCSLACFGFAIVS